MEEKDLILGGPQGGKGSSSCRKLPNPPQTLCPSGSAQGLPPSDFQCPFLSVFSPFTAFIQTRPSQSLSSKFPFLLLESLLPKISIYHNKQFSLFTIKFKCWFHNARISFDQAIFQKFPILNHKFIEKLRSGETELALRNSSASGRKAGSPFPPQRRKEDAKGVLDVFEQNLEFL